MSPGSQVKNAKKTPRRGNTKSCITHYSLSAILEGMNQRKSPCEMIFIATCKATIKTWRKMLSLPSSSILGFFSHYFSFHSGRAFMFPSDTQSHRKPPQGKTLSSVLLSPSVSSCEMTLFSIITILIFTLELMLGRVSAI